VKHGCSSTYQYYIFALIFLVFDVEMVFLYPWAAAFDQIPLFAVLEAFLFIGFSFRVWSMLAERCTEVDVAPMLVDFKDG